MDALSQQRNIEDLTAGLLELADERSDVVRFSDRLLTRLLALFRADVAGFYNDGPPCTEQIFYQTPETRPCPQAQLTAMYQEGRRLWKLLPTASETQAEPPVSLAGGQLSHAWRSARGGGVLLIQRHHPFTADVLPLAETALPAARRLLEITFEFAASQSQVARDFLTGLFNRRYLNQQLPQEIERSRRFGYGFSLVLVDLDGFKQFNDTLGHRSGDELLAQVGSILRTSLRRIDIPTRYGGDEFAIILPQTTAEQAETLLTRVEQRISGLPRDMGVDLLVGASFGVASYPADGLSMEELIESADERLYRAKEERKAALGDGRESRNG